MQPCIISGVFWSWYIPGGGLLLGSFAAQAVPRLREEKLLLLLLLLLLLSPVPSTLATGLVTRATKSIKTFSLIKIGHCVPKNNVNARNRLASVLFLLFLLVFMLTSPSHSLFCHLSFCPQSFPLLTHSVLSCLTPFVSFLDAPGLRERRILERRDAPMSLCVYDDDRHPTRW